MSKQSGIHSKQSSIQAPQEQKSDVPQPTESDSDWDVNDPFQCFNFTNYLKEEITQSVRKKQEQDGTNNRGPFTNRVYTFVTVPQYLESFMTYGFLQCLDHLLVIYTFLPLRCCLTVLRLLMRILTRVFSSLLNFDTNEDLVKFSLLCLCTILLGKFDSSVAYHEIRTQSVIKIYIFFNLLEVADRLLSAVCQDALDDLLYTVSKSDGNNKNSVNLSTNLQSHSENSIDNHYFIIIRDVILQYGFALLCLFAHCFLLLCQVTTLNVAFNSQNKSLVTVFISNNFVELKGNVFRKMGKTNLFQIACADVRERFHYSVWLFIIVCRNMNETGWNLDDLQTILFDVICIFLAEVAVDWVKHSFITKFNVIPSDVYEEYTVSIAYDLLLCRQGKNTSDHFDLLSRRMGLTPIPLSCLINTMLLQTVRTPTTLYMTLGLAIGFLFAIKIVTNLTLMSMAYSHVRAYIKAASKAQNNDAGATAHSGFSSSDNAFTPAAENANEPTHTDESLEKNRLSNGIQIFESDHYCVKQLAKQLQELTVNKTNNLLNDKIFSNKERPMNLFTNYGYDQPTKDEEQFLPFVLRHRRVRSDSGKIEKTNQSDDANWTNYVSHSGYVENSMELSTNKIQIHPNSYQLSASGDEFNDFFQSIHSPINYISEIDSSPSVQKIDPTRQSSTPSRQGITTTEYEYNLPITSIPPAVPTVSTTATTNTNIASHTTTTTDVTNEVDNKSHASRLVYSALSEEYVQTQKIEFEAQSSHEKEFTMDLSQNPIVSICSKQRSYSIDLGILSKFRNMMNNGPDISEFVSVSDQIETERKSVQINVISNLPKRRIRTLTEGSGITPPHLPTDATIPILWERSSRNSTVNQFNFTQHRPTSIGRVKQPLSDIDRYSMVEGQIS